MVLRSMHECMHAAQFCSGFFFYQGKLLLGLLCYEDDSFTILFRFKVLSAKFYFHKPITLHLELYLFYCFIHFVLYIGQY